MKCLLQTLRWWPRFSDVRSALLIRVNHRAWRRDDRTLFLAHWLIITAGIVNIRTLSLPDRLPQPTTAQITIVFTNILCSERKKTISYIHVNNVESWEQKKDVRQDGRLSGPGPLPADLSGVSSGQAEGATGREAILDASRRPTRPLQRTKLTKFRLSEPIVRVLKWHSGTYKDHVNLF